jgi:hypothetical protein
MGSTLSTVHVPTVHDIEYPIPLHCVASAAGGAQPR